MTKEEAKERIRQDPSFHLQPDKQSIRHAGKPKGYICPICGSGSGRNGTGITTKDGIHFRCWAGCFKSADIIDIIGLEYGLNDYNAKLEKACSLYDIDYSLLEDNSIPYKPTGGAKHKKSPYSHENASRSDFIHQRDTNYTQDHKSALTGKIEPLGAKSDFTLLYEEWRKHRCESNYLEQRGISKATQELFSIGYCPKWRHPKSPKMQPSPRVIIPTSPYSYLARYAGDGDFIDWKGNIANKSKVGRVHLFNLQALDNKLEPAFVVEGEIDAMSIAEVGHEAIALGSTSNCEKLIEHVKHNKPPLPLIIALDGDKSGEETTQKILAGLKSISVECYSADINGSHKDANEHLMADREGFRQALEMAIKLAMSAKETAKQEYMRGNNALSCLEEGFEDDTPCTPTGFKALDSYLDGGLYEGLYVIGAISSLGKTTLALQIADQVARSGHDVIIFSLEMAKRELVAKSLSRLTAEIALAEHKPITMAKTIRGITVRRLYNDRTKAETKLIAQAKSFYKEYAARVFIIEGIGNVGVAEIRQTIERHISFTGNTPVVVIDYLQIIAPHNERATDKQNTDKAVLELKRISRDYKLPIIGISSFNRENYKVPVAMQAFKESGAIEYSSDVLIGLQLKGAGDTHFDVDRAKNQEPRLVESKILKNRNGRTGLTLLFRYYPRFNYFVEDEMANRHFMGKDNSSTIR